MLITSGWKRISRCITHELKGMQILLKTPVAKELLRNCDHCVLQTQRLCETGKKKTTFFFSTLKTEKKCNYNNNNKKKKHPQKRNCTGMSKLSSSE